MRGVGHAETLHLQARRSRQAEMNSRTFGRLVFVRRISHVVFVAVSMLLTSCATGNSRSSAPYHSALYDVDVRPQGYNWHHVPSQHGSSAAYYARDRATNRTLYVGPDGIYYAFAHAPPITPQDLRSFWKPHDVPTHGTGAGPVALFAALGDSITYGLFASRLCARTPAPVLVASCRDGVAYADVVARRLPVGAFYQNLAISGEFTGDLRRDELRTLDVDATIVLLNIGRNDEMPNDAGPVRFRLAPWEAEYGRVIAAIRERAPHSKLIVANLPNYAYFPAYAGRARLWRDKVTRVANSMNSVINAYAKDGATVVDIRCAQLEYAPSGFADVGHPNDLGHAWLASLVSSAVANPRPPASRCPPFSEQP
jgi:lysophospholipase L1-like esterase